MTRLPNCLFVILSCFVSVLSFNLDLDNLVKYRGSPGSMFGFTVAQHSFQQQNSVIVGAPEDETDQPGVSKGGAVYRCFAFGDNNCERIRFDRNGESSSYCAPPYRNQRSFGVNFAVLGVITIFICRDTTT
ncbi:hypothetical protein GE061_015772 [Apolygus lucorum]|uniref:Uncharacterized protein n=1 Tax=Apolygus lucorum TaxID=248454 RepID=A0A6A4JR91_APOLU|nr:hypothetical protein GE061_015772 [Apolygus lucorum]